MKEDQEVCEASLDQHKRRKVAYEVSVELDAPWPTVESSDHSEEDATSVSDDDSEESIVDPELREKLCKKVTSLRTWQWTPLGQLRQQQTCNDGSKPTGLELTLMCYNVLSQELLESNDYLYGHCSSSSLQWKYRKNNLIAEIKEVNADIVCLQEVQEDHYEEVFQPEFKLLGYNSVYKKRTGDKNDGCSIFYKTDVLSLETHVNIEYFKPGNPVLDRDNVALLAVLKPLSDSSIKLCIATTHLLFNPRRGDIKLAQLQVLLAELDKAAFKEVSEGKCLYHPCILCGDMNSEPFSPLYNFLTRGSIHYHGMYSGNVSGQYDGKDRGRILHDSDILLPDLEITTDCRYTSEIKLRDAQSAESISVPPVLQHRFRFESVYKHGNSDGTFEVTTHHMRASCSVDNIFFSAQHLKDNPLRLLGSLRLLSDDEVEEIGGLPNAAISSDHLALVAKFLVKKSEV